MCEGMNESLWLEAYCAAKAFALIKRGSGQIKKVPHDFFQCLGTKGCSEKKHVITIEEAGIFLLNELSTR